jgi:hypothetical protein
MNRSVKISIDSHFSIYSIRLDAGVVVDREGDDKVESNIRRNVMIKATT